MASRPLELTEEQKRHFMNEAIKEARADSAILHAETDALENAGRLSPGDYAESVLFTTMSPCDMCSGASLLFKIPHIVVGENKTFKGPEEYVRSRGVKLEVMNDAECITLMEDFIAKHPKLWYEGTLEDK